MARRKQGDLLARQEAQGIIWRSSTGEEHTTHYIVTWDLRHEPLPVIQARLLLRDAGLGALDIPDIAERGALLRALREMTEDRLLAQVWNDRDEQAWSLVRQGETDRATMRVEFAQEHTISYMKRPAKGEPSIVYSSPAAEAQIAPVVARYEAGYTQRDIAERVLTAAIRQCGGVKMRQGGGVYLIPKSGAETVRRLGHFMDALAEATGGTAHLTTLQLEDTARVQDDLRWHSHQALLSDLARMRADLKDMLRPERAGHIGSETIAGYLAKADALGQRAALWRDMARLDLKEIDGALDALRGAFEAVRVGVTPDAFCATLAPVDAAIQAVTTTGPSLLDEMVDDVVTDVVDDFQDAVVADVAADDWLRAAVS